MRQAKKESETALDALNAATERKLKERVEEVTESAFEAWARHNPALLDRLLERLYGKVEQITKVQLDDPMALRLALHVASLVFNDLPDLPARLEAMARQIAQQLESATGGWHQEEDALPAGSEEAGDAPRPEPL